MKAQTIRIKPDFIIIGAMKCATSTLHDQLKKHTSFCMTTPKEPNFFSDDDNTTAILEKWGDKLLEGSAETRLATAILTSRTGRGTTGTNSVANNH